MRVGREHDALVPILRKCGVPRDGVLVVHSAIARLSRNGYAAEALTESFLDHVADGTLIMPTMTWRTVTPKNPVWDEVATASHTGVLSEIFRTRYASNRSIHPTHSVAAYGRAAAVLLGRHHIDDSPVSANSPYGLMREHDAHIMMLGVGLETCTAIHFAEETIAADIYLRPPASAETYQCRDRNGVVHTVCTRRHWRLDRDFPKFAPPLAAKNVLHMGQIENCPYTIVSLRDLLQEVTAALHADKHATLRGH
jgi:aminoglycoside 3-N-acetyltransferase